MSPAVMMLSRDCKRVPLDFDWPQGKVWTGYVDTEHDWPKCTVCGGGGETPEARAISESFYAFGCPDSLAWCDKMGQAEVDNLLAEGRLQTCVNRKPTDDNPRDWEWISQPRTAAEVNEANRRNGRSSLLDSHDGINRMIAVRFRCERLGIPTSCPACDGHGDIATDDERAAAEAWQPTEPPTGDGYQLWESVSEGSPCSPVFATLQRLAEWLSANDTSILAGKSAADWMRVLEGEVFGSDIHTGDLVAAEHVTEGGK